MRQVYSPVLLLILALFLSGCGGNTSLPSSPQRVPVLLTLSSESLPSSLSPAGVPTGLDAASVGVYLLNDSGGRTLEQTVNLTLSNPNTHIDLLAGETYDFEVSLKDASSTEVAFDAEQHMVVPNLNVVFHPVAIISTVQQGNAYFDGTYLVVPFDVLTPGGGVAPHTDYSLTVTATGGSITTQGPLGVEVTPVAASSPVTLDVQATGMLADHTEGAISAQFEIFPSSVTPGQVNFMTDLVAPTVEIVSSTIDMPVTGSRTISITASDNAGLASIRLYVNMALVKEQVVSGTSFSSGMYGFYSLTAQEARTYTVAAVAIDRYGNSSVHTVRINAK